MSKKSIRTFRITSGLGIIAAGIIILILFVSAGRDETKVQMSSLNTDLKYSVYPVNLPSELQFAGEKVPLEYFDVKEDLDKELLINVYWQSHTMLLIKRANRYFPIIENVLRKNGIPADMKYLAVAESDLTNSVSPDQAVGFWQFVDGTARDYRLEVNDEVDERYHIEKSTEAACVFLKESYNRYSSWTMAAASYNMGRSGLNEQIERQKSDYYYDLLLNEETGRYIYRVLAIKLILSNPEEYGFYAGDKDLYPVIPSYEVTVDGTVEDFADFASKYGINYKVLKIFNPWLRDKELTNPHKKTYYIRIPKDGLSSRDLSDF
jgi:membrane-bound lytic murein transglycosylase D